MRRYLTLMEGQFPRRVGEHILSLENSSNPLFDESAEPCRLTADPDFPVKRPGDPGVTAEYLLGGLRRIVR